MTVPVLRYGSESWTKNNKEERKQNLNCQNENFEEWGTLHKEHK